MNYLQEICTKKASSSLCLLGNYIYIDDLFPSLKFNVQSLGGALLYRGISGPVPKRHLVGVSGNFKRIRPTNRFGHSSSELSPKKCTVVLSPPHHEIEKSMDDWLTCNIQTKKCGSHYSHN